MKAFFIRWVMTTIAVLVAERVVPGIDYTNWQALLVASLMLGFANAFLKPILMLLSLPFLVLTFGFFTILINSLLLWIVGQVVHGFTVTGFWSAFWGSLVISVVTILLKIIQKERVVVQAARASSVSRRPPGSSGGGRVIDV